MADNEEKIRGELRIQIKQFLWPTCKECGGKCKTEEVIKFCKDSQPGITKQEAIEVMAKAFWPWDFFPSEIDEGKGWNDLNNWQKDKYRGQAKQALEALLEGGNK